MFDSLTGNDKVKDALKRMIAADRLPGAMLFVGEEGIGKKLFALEVARALNCRSRKGVEGCGVCPICVRISKINYIESNNQDDLNQIFWTDYLDVGLVEAPKRVLRVAQMRQIEAEANFRPIEGKARVFIIDDADELNDASANALLKVLEEPPSTSYLILITARPAMLLTTIRSRCQTIRFAPLTPTEIEQHLTRNKVLDKKAAQLRARTAGGSIGRALEGDVEQFTDQRTAMLAVVKALSGTPNIARLLKSAEGLNEAQYKDEFEQRLDVLETLIRDAWMLSVGVDTNQLVNEDLAVELRELSKGINPDRAASWILQIEDLREQLIVNINRKISTDALFTAMADPVAPRRTFMP
jgi:DNA polymerase-3 subunit delta'